MRVSISLDCLKAKNLHLHLNDVYYLELIRAFDGKKMNRIDRYEKPDKCT